MGARQRDWALRKRAWLTAVLGGKCVDCGATEDLTFDVREPVKDEHHGLESSLRMSFYVRQWRQGNLAIRCRVCNSRKGAKAKFMPNPGP